MDNFGKYVIERKIGEGGTATVYLAKETVLNRDVVLKIMSNQKFSGAIDFKKLFIDEAQRIAKLNHPNIIQVYEAGVEDDRIYIAMEYLSGGTLKDRIVQQQSFDPLQVLKDIAKALHYVYRETGTIHRDIKPANIIFRKSIDGHLDAVLTDFGISKTEGIDSDFTSFDMKVGTPRYMSPEQLLGGNIDQRSDLYSLGIVFYEMLVGEKPYDADNTVAVIKSRTRSSTPKLPPEYKKYQKILDKLITPHPDDRFPNAKELLDTLGSIKPKKVSPRLGKSNHIKSILIGTLSTITVSLLGYFSYINYEESISTEEIRKDINRLESHFINSESDKSLLASAVEEADKMKIKYPNNHGVDRIYKQVYKYKNEVFFADIIAKADSLLRDEKLSSAKNILEGIQNSPAIPAEQKIQIIEKISLINKKIKDNIAISSLGTIEIASNQKHPKIKISSPEKMPRITITSSNDVDLYFHCLYQSPKPHDDQIFRIYPLPKFMQEISDLRPYKKHIKRKNARMLIGEEKQGQANIYCYATSKDIKQSFISLFKDNSEGIPTLKEEIQLDEVEGQISKFTNGIYTKNTLQVNFKK